MFLMRALCLRFLAALTLAVALGGASAQAGVTYKIRVSTSGVSGSGGYLDLQFNPATVGTTPAATATVSGLKGYESFQFVPPEPGLEPVPGAVVGDPNSTLVLKNLGATNDYYAAVTFGTSLEFLLNLDGPAFRETAVDGSSFGFALYNSAGNPLNSADGPNVALLDLLPYGDSPGVGINIVTNAAYSGGADAKVTAVPEASTVMMGGLIAVAGLIAARRGRRKAT